MKLPIIKKYRFGLAKQAFVVSVGRLVEHLQDVYRRPNLAVKVFDYETIVNEEDFMTVLWGDSPKAGEPRRNTTIWEATQIQNIASWYGLAPRVYGLITVFLAGAYRPAQLVEYIDEEHGTNEDAYQIYEKVIALGKEYGFAIEKDDVSGADIRGGKLIDFQTFSFTKPYIETVKEKYIDGKYGKVYYQDVPELELSGGPRKSGQRVKELRLDTVEFNEKRVLDVGCAGGFFTRYASDKGASYVLGVDIDPKHIESARNLANLLGYFNNDYVVMDIEKEVPEQSSWDVTFFLSMNYHVGMPEYIRSSNNGVLVFEDNGKITRGQDLLKDDYLHPEYKEGFRQVEFMGRATDHGNKPIYILRKDPK